MIKPNHYTLLYVLLVTSLFLLKCKKDDISCLECDKCKDFSSRDLRGTQHASIEFKDPCYNPNNANQFVCVKIVNRMKSLVKYDLTTQKEIELLNNLEINGQPKWGRNGVIVFSGKNKQLFLVNDDGSSLNGISLGNQFEYPDWKNDSIICAELSIGIWLIYSSEVSISGKITDTTYSQSFTLRSINQLNEKAYISNINDPNISIKTSSEVKKLSSFESTGRNTIEGIAWSPDNTTIYYSTIHEGLFSVNKNTNKVIKVRNGCDTRSYSNLSISPDSKSILVERIDASFDEASGDVLEHAGIYIMDLNGKNEKKLF